MDEEDSAQGFSLKSEQPGSKRTKEENKDGKKKKRHSAQDTGSESGKSSPFVGVRQDAQGYSITVTPAHTGQEDFNLISAATSSPKEDLSKGKNPAERKTPKKTISYSAVSGSSQSVLTGKPKASKPQRKSKTSKVPVAVHNEDCASEEASGE